LLILREIQKMVMRIPLCFLVTLPATGTTGVESKEVNPKQACSSSLFTKENAAASPASGCRKGAPSSPAFSDVPNMAQPLERPEQGHEHESRLFVFVSFSLPESSLKNLAYEAQIYKVTLVMRGLFEDSFIKTAQKIQKLGIAVDINPDLFETHHITAVPTFVWVRNGHPPQTLKGNVTLAFAVKKFEGQQPTGEAP